MQRDYYMKEKYFMYREFMSHNWEMVDVDLDVIRSHKFNNGVKRNECLCGAYIVEEPALSDEGDVITMTQVFLPKSINECPFTEEEHLCNEIIT